MTPTWDQVVDGLAALEPAPGDAIVWNGTTWVSAPAPTGTPGPPGAPAWLANKVKAADQAFTSTTPADVADLTQPLAASTRYFFRAIILFSTAATTTGIGLGVTGPTGSSVAARVMIPTAATTMTGGAITALDGIVLGTGSAGANTPLAAVVEGTILTGVNGGNLAIRARTEVAGSAATVRAGSHLSVWP